MKLENQVCTLEQAKRLKELGVKQQANFYWECHGVNVSLRTSEQIESSNWIVFAAFTVAELGEMLPDVYSVSGIWFSICDAGNDKNGKNLEPPNAFSLFTGKTVHDLQDTPFKNLVFETEAEARAEYLIYLLENNLIKP